MFTRLSVCVSQGSTLEPNTTLTEDALGAKAAADAGNNCTGMFAVCEERREMYCGSISRRRMSTFGWWWRSSGGVREQVTYKTRSIEGRKGEEKGEGGDVDA